MRARDNPFATVHIHRIRYQFTGLTWEQFLARLVEANYRGAIVGPEGAGKSTLLEDLRPRLAARGLTPVPLRLTQESPRFDRDALQQLSATVTPSHVVLLDGAEQLSRWAWWSFRRRVRRAGGLIITAHRPGLLPTILDCRTTLELLTEIVGRLAGKAHIPDAAEMTRLFQRHRGNLREALRELYDVCSAQPGEAVVLCR